jgi:hypothetical protein
MIPNVLAFRNRSSDPFTLKGLIQAISAVGREVENKRLRSKVPGLLFIKSGEARVQYRNLPKAFGK